MNDRVRLLSGITVAILILGGVTTAIHVTSPPSSQPMPVPVATGDRAIAMVESSSDTPTCDDPFTVSAVRTLLQPSADARILGVTGAAPDPVRTNEAVQACRATVVTAKGHKLARYALRRAPRGPGWKLSARFT